MSCSGCSSCSPTKADKWIEKKHIVLYIIALIIFGLAFIPAFSGGSTILFLIVILLAGYDLLWNGIKNIFKLDFTEDTLMTIAIIAAFVLGEFPESCMVVLLFKLGEFIEKRAISKSNESINSIVNIQSKTANLLDDNQNICVVDVESVNVGDIIFIKPGEMIPLDCVVMNGTSSIDTSNITGESKPITIYKDFNLMSGSINLTGTLTCRVTKDFQNSMASQIVDLVYEASNNKGNTESFITKFSRIYTPIVILLAIVIAVVPPVFGLDLRTCIMNALVLLVASCPCSIVISIPLAFFSCIGAISKKGLLIKGTKHIKSLAKTSLIAFDKTGTLTTGKMEVSAIHTYGKFSREDLILYMVNLEKNSNHPISTAILKLDNNISNIKVANYEEIPGHGIYGKINGHEIIFGNTKLLDKYNVSYESKVADAIYLAVDGVLARLCFNHRRNTF